MYLDTYIDRWRRDREKEGAIERNIELEKKRKRERENERERKRERERDRERERERDIGDENQIELRTRM